MDVEKLTKKSLQTIKDAQNIAAEYGHAQITAEHLLYALLDQEDGLIPSLFDKNGWNTQGVLLSLKSVIESFARVSTSGRQADKIYVSPECDKILSRSEKTAKDENDDYISVEHIDLCTCDVGLIAL